MNNQGLAGSGDREGGEREELRETIAAVSNPISPVHNVCVRGVSLGWLPLRTLKSNLESKHLCLCLSHNGKPSRALSFYTCKSFPAFSVPVCVIY